MEHIFNKKLWLLAAPLVMLMAGCMHSDDKNNNGTSDGTGDGTDTGTGDGTGAGTGGGGGTTTPTGAGPALVALGTAGNFVILAKQEIAANNPKVTGDIGVISGVTAMDNGVSGFLEDMDGAGTFSTSYMVTGKIYAPNYATPTPTKLTTAITDMVAAYNDAAGRTATLNDLGSGEIGGLILAPGLYKSSGPVLISSNVTLSGGPNDVWIFQVSGDLNQAPTTQVVLQGGAQAKNIFWQVVGDSQEDSDVYIGDTAHFEGIILARTQISLGTKATMKGRLLSQHVVTLDENTVTQPAP